jgi:hypothetical protein
MLEKLLNWLRAAQPRPEPRLTSDQVEAIARAALPDWPMPLVAQEATSDEDGRIVWVVTSASIGAGKTVRIADDSGSILEIIDRPGR